MASPQSVGTANLAIATERPYTIILSDAGVQNLLGYAPEDIRGRGLQLLHGPKTDPLLLHLCKVRAASLRPRRARRRRGAVGRCAAAYQPEGCASSGGSETDSPT